MLGFTRRRILQVLVVAMLVCSFAASAHAQTGDDLAALNAQVEALFKADKRAEALPLAERAVKAAEKLHGPDDPRVAGPLTMLATVLGLGRVEEFEALHKR